MSELGDDAVLTADEILLFGPCVEAQTWHPIFLQEQRAPSAVAAGRAKFGPVFNDDGVGKIAVIRPCVSRGRRVRGLPPVYTPPMLEAHASVFNGWPMFLDHAPAELMAAVAKHGRKVSELGGQLLTAGWSRDFTHADDEQYGYRKGGVLAEVWATPFLRNLVGNNPNLLHTSINAWPTSGKPGPVPWRPSVKGMVIEGIRRQPQGSVDYVVRGGAGGRLLVEGAEDEGAWPELGEWAEDDRRLVVSLAEGFYASRAMPNITLPSTPGEVKDWLAEHAPHLLPALEESAPPASTGRQEPGAGAAALTEADVRRITQESMSESLSGMPSVDEFETRLREQTERTLSEREQQRQLAARAEQLIERAEGILPSWKTDLRTRYAMTTDGPPATLLVEAEQADDGRELTPMQVLERNVVADIERCRDLIAEAQGKPRVKGEGARRPDPGESHAARVSKPHWRRAFAEMGLAESEDKALEVFGAKVEG